MKIFKKLTALYWAQLHLREVRALCDLALSLPTEHRNTDVFFGLWTGVVVAYARSFTQNKGVSAIGAKFKQFDQQRDQALHDRLVEMRHHLHAHKDRSWEEEVATKLFKPNFVSRVFVTVFDDGETEWEVQRPVFPDKYFSDVKQLCNVQAVRLKQESDKMLKRFLESHGVTPGGYDLEMDFP
ncbi:MAG: hypothetical protein M3R59_01695 [Verrucomicrobiota bacterium]|nr:hypothetical protein [Verrucomicrobiota bacterium]